MEYLTVRRKVVVEYKYDAWGNHAVPDANGTDISDATRRISVT